MPRSPSRASIQKAFGKTVRSLRLKAGLAQEALAFECEMKRGYVGGLERGLHAPTLDTVYRLLPGLGVTLVEFAKEFERQLRMIRNRQQPQA